jgi:hypothetical protein
MLNGTSWVFSDAVTRWQTVIASEKDKTVPIDHARNSDRRCGPASSWSPSGEDGFRPGFNAFLESGDRRHYIP